MQKRYDKTSKKNKGGGKNKMGEQKKEKNLMPKKEKIYIAILLIILLLGFVFYLNLQITRRTRKITAVGQSTNQLVEKAETIPTTRTDSESTIIIIPRNDH